jgi:enamine deaminase RidA (YjgF/YER057c/UK114 family)
MTQAVRGVGVALGALLLWQSLALPLQRKKKNEDLTQTLDALPEPPVAVVAESTRLNWRAASSSGQGLLSQQTRDALKTLLLATRGARLVRIRAWVSGPGDLRRVGQIVAELCGERKLALPALTVVQVGGLEREGAQVSLEALVEEKKAVNPHGVAFGSAAAAEPGQALDRLRRAMDKVGASPALGLTCSVTSAPLMDEARQVAARLFPGVATTLVRAQRMDEAPRAVCEALGRLEREPALERVEGAVAVGPARLVVSGAQLAFRYQAADAQLAYQRLERSLAAQGGSLKRALSLGVYPLSAPLAELARSAGVEFLSAARPPVGETLRYEGLPALDASFAIEAVALAR